MRILANDQLVLQINKINISPDKSYVKYNQNERGKVIDINVIDNDGINAYDLTNKKIRFVDDKEDNKLVLDDEADNPGHFTRTADAQGKFSYTFHDLVYQRSGIARFEIYTDSEHIDATANFEIQIETTSSPSVANESYISSLESLVAHYRSAINTTETETNQLIDSLNKQIAQAISDGNKSVADEVSSIKEIIQQMQTEYKSKSDALAKLTSDWQTQTQTIQNSADDQLKKINENANSEIDKLKQDFDKIDFTKFVTGEQIKNYYTKEETDLRLQQAGKVKSVDNIQPDSNGNINTDHFTKSETTQKLATKLSFVKCDSPQAAYDASKKPASDGSMVIGIYDPNDGPTSAVIGDKTVTISTLNDAITALQTQVSGLANLQSVVAGKADSATVFLKTDAQTLKQTLENEIANAGKVKTVNNIQPDSSGNITIPAPDLSSKANQTDLQNLVNRVTAIENKSEWTKATSESDAITKSQAGGQYYW